MDKARVLYGMDDIRTIISLTALALSTISFWVALGKSRRDRLEGNRPILVFEYATDNPEVQPGQKHQNALTQDFAPIRN